MYESCLASGAKVLSSSSFQQQLVRCAPDGPWILFYCRQDDIAVCFALVVVVVVLRRENPKKA
eukprot:6260327-Amphidinium_carterae.2